MNGMVGPLKKRRRRQDPTLIRRYAADDLEQHASRQDQGSFANRPVPLPLVCGVNGDHMIARTAGFPMMEYRSARNLDQMVLQFFDKKITRS